MLEDDLRRRMHGFYCMLMGAILSGPIAPAMLSLIDSKIAEVAEIGAAMVRSLQAAEGEDDF